MKNCVHECGPVCDFCIYFDWYAIEERNQHNREGYCKKKEKDMPAHGDCEDFICMNVDISELNEEEQKIKREYKR